MFKSFKEIEQHIKVLGIKKKLALANAHYEDVLSPVVKAKKEQIIDPILIGIADKIIELLKKLGESPKDYEIISCDDEKEAGNIACSIVKNGEADILMKGLMQTSTFMRAVLDKERYGFVPLGAQLSQATVLVYQKRLMIATDCAVNVAPDYNEKIKIINNAVALGKCLQMECPKVAVITPVEVVNPNMQSTIDAAMLSKANQRGQIKDCIIDGPLGLDNAVSPDAASHKGIESEVAGQADILLMPDLCSGNIFTKALTYFSETESSGTLNGTTVAVVMTSRTDTPKNKYYSILIAIMQSISLRNTQ